jgi:signal transduction histidine kinase
MMPQDSLSGIAYIACDASLRITEVSPHAAELLQMEKGAGDLIGDCLTDACLVLIGSEEKLDAVVQGTLPDMVIDQVNVAVPFSDVRYVSLTVLPQGDGILVLVSDVTRFSLQQQRLQQQHNELALLHEKVAEQNQQLRTLNQQLSEVSQRKSDMLAIATHDLRSPLSTILGYVDLMLEDEFGHLDEEMTEAVEIIQQEGLRMLELIKGLLNLRRLESASPTNRSVINLGMLVQQVLHSFHNQAHLANVQLDYAGVAGVEPGSMLKITGDSDMLQQAVGNLVSNGIKYAGEGSTVWLHLQLLPADVSATMQDVELDPTRLWCALQVADNGKGMKEEDVQRIFEPFFRSREARTSRRDGTGLGLTIVQQAVQQHAGVITVQSSLGAGTTFVIYLPVEVEVDQAESDE